MRSMRPGYRLLIKELLPIDSMDLSSINPLTIAQFQQAKHHLIESMIYKDKKMQRYLFELFCTICGPDGVRTLVKAAENEYKKILYWKNRDRYM